MNQVIDKLAELNAKQIAAAMPRAQRAWKLRQAGETWATIGKLLGVSRQRAHALAKKVCK